MKQKTEKHFWHCSNKGLIMITMKMKIIKFTARTILSLIALLITLVLLGNTPIPLLSIYSTHVGIASILAGSLFFALFSMLYMIFALISLFSIIKEFHEKELENINNKLIRLNYVWLFIIFNSFLSFYIHNLQYNEVNKDGYEFAIMITTKNTETLHHYQKMKGLPLSIKNLNDLRGTFAKYSFPEKKEDIELKTLKGKLLDIHSSKTSSSNIK